MLLFLSPTCGFRQVFQGFYPATTYSGWWFQPTPLKNMSSSVGSWDDDIPINEMESHSKIHGSSHHQPAINIPLPED